MTRKMWLALALALPAALLLMLWAVVPVGAQGSNGVPFDVLFTFDTTGEGWIGGVRAYYSPDNACGMGVSGWCLGPHSTYGNAGISLRADGLKAKIGVDDGTFIVVESVEWEWVATGPGGKTTEARLYPLSGAGTWVSMDGPKVFPTTLEHQVYSAGGVAVDDRNLDVNVLNFSAWHNGAGPWPQLKIGNVRVTGYYCDTGETWQEVGCSYVPPTPTPAYNPIGEIDPMEYGGTCVYTTTMGNLVLTGANILGNPSFEIYNYTTFPAGWERYDPAVTVSSISRSSAAAHSGSWGMFYNPGQYGVGQGVRRTFNIDSTTETIAVGAYVQSPEGGGSVSIFLDGQLLNRMDDLAQGWFKIGGQYIVEGPKTVEIALVGSGPAEGGLYFDDLWVYESSVPYPDFSVICPAPSSSNLGSPPEPGMDFGDDVPAPAPTAFGVCYDCIRPRTLVEIGGWIKWLLCMIANLFRCELYLWLQVLNNLSFGIFGRILSLILWLPDAANVFLDWFEQSVNGSLDWLVGVWDAWRQNFVAFLRNIVQSVLDTELVQDVWLFVSFAQRAWEYVEALIAAIVSQIRSLFDAAVTVVELVQTVIEGVITSWREPPDPDVFSEFLPGGASAQGAETAEGITDSKIVWLVLVALASFDAIFASFGLQYLRIIVMAVVGFGVIYWTLRQFQDILPV